MILDNKNIIITGGTSGIGRRLVEDLHEKNNIVVVGRCREKLDQLKKEYPSISTEVADFSSLEEVEELSTRITAANSRIDLLINNAAVQYVPQFLDDDFHLETINIEVTTNFTSLCLFTSLLMPSLIKDTRSIVLNINSGLGLTPKASSAIYCATKSALDSFSTSLGYQLERTNIRVLQSFMPLVDTKMTEGRGSGKMTVKKASQKIIGGIVKEQERNYIGKVKILALLLRVIPSLGVRLVKNS